MPAPVPFNISLAPFPINFAGTPAEFAEAIRARLVVAPAEPWSSFQNGGSIPSSDVGPVLLNGTEWRVFDSALGGYTFHKQNGAGLVDATVTKAKLAAGAAGSVLIYDANGRPAELTAASGTSGQVMTLVGGTTPMWVDSFAPTGKYFETTLSGDQSINTNGTYQVAFDSVRTQANVVFDTTNKKVPVLAGQVWLFYAALQLEDLGAPTAPATGSIGALTVSNPPTQAEVVALRNATETFLAAYNNAMEVVLSVRVDGTNVGPSAVVDFNFNSAMTRQGINCAGIVPISADGYVDVSVEVGETTPASPGLKISANLSSRFGGVRII